MPELTKIAHSHSVVVYAEPYLPVRTAIHPPIRPPTNSESIFWRLEVDEEKEAQGRWIFKPDIPVQRDTLLYLKIEVFGEGHGGRENGAWVAQ
jgi:hypothetical protein